MNDLILAENDLQRFLAKFIVNPKTGCWEWTASLDTKGYGQFWLKSNWRLNMAHRVAYFYWQGIISDSLQIDHLCRNKKCINPDHLEPVTNQENQIRAKTHCLKGHPYDYRYSSGRRACWPCTRQRQRNWERRKHGHKPRQFKTGIRP